MKAAIIAVFIVAICSAVALGRGGNKAKKGAVKADVCSELAGKYCHARALCRDDEDSWAPCNEAFVYACCELEGSCDSKIAFSEGDLRTCQADISKNACSSPKSKACQSLFGASNDTTGWYCKTKCYRTLDQCSKASGGDCGTVQRAICIAYDGGQSRECYPTHALCNARRSAMLNNPSTYPGAETCKAVN